MAWKHISEVVKETEKYIDDRRKGLIKSCKTGYKKLDEANLDGFEWGSAITIGGRPAIGKTIVSSCIERGMLENNDISDIAILDFNWEMAARVLLIRELAAEQQVSYREVVSAGSSVNDDVFEKYQGMLKRHASLPIYFMEEPKTAKEFGDNVKRKRDELAKLGKTKIIVRVDHTILGRKSASESSTVEMLLNFMFEGNVLKKESNMIFFWLTQLNRELEDRQEDGTDKAFPRQSDVYGGDATSMYSEVMILLNRPTNYGISYYGNRPDGVVCSPDDLFLHVVKNRNSTPNLIIPYTTNFKTMSIKEKGYEPTPTNRESKEFV